MKFLMEVEINGNEEELTALLKKTGAIEITIPQNHEE